MQQLDYNNGGAVFSSRSVQRCYKQKTSLELSSGLYGESVKRRLEPEAEQ
jgi:hypothetical protein